MPAWKVFDKETESELRSRVSGNQEVLVEERPAVLNGRDAVILAPTAHQGITMLITMRRKSESAIASVDSVVPPAIESIWEAAPGATESEPIVPQEAADDFFGPTTWERVEQSELSDFAFESRASELSPMQSLEPVYDPRNDYAEEIAPASTEQTIPAPRETRERHYIATGFLGLDETVEDDEDVAREKRPWWKKLFID